MNRTKPKHPGVQFHLLSFEGPDEYARAGGVATRVCGLAQALAAMDHDAHLWFIGDPDRPGHEQHDRLHLHRWCQWISRYHPGGVYDGEEGKRRDYAASLAPYLFHEVLAKTLREGHAAVILADEWQTVDAVLHLDWLLRAAGLRDKVTMFWNANNNYSFERIDWQRLAQAAVVTTVSRYMKHLMWRHGVDPLVIANGLSPEAYAAPEADAVTAFRKRVVDRCVLAKVARWHPDKRWLLAIESVRAMKAKGWRPLLIARGGVEPHGAEVLAAAVAAGLRVVDCSCNAPGYAGLLGAVDGPCDADVLNLQMPLNEESSRLLFHCADAVLANSAHEPFGLVGLETMAVGGVAYVGSSGEDYAVPGHNAIVLETNDPQEFVDLFQSVRNDIMLEQALRRAGRTTAQLFRWPRIIERMLLPRLAMLASARDVAVTDVASIDEAPRGAASPMPFPVRRARRGLGIARFARLKFA